MVPGGGVMSRRWLACILSLATACGGGGGGDGGGPAGGPPANPGPPQVVDLRLSMVSDASITLSWVTENDGGPVSTGAEVRYRAATGGSEIAAHDLRGTDTVAPVHYVRLTGLQPETGYTFTVFTNGTEGESGTFTTARSLNPLAGEVDLTPLKVKGRAIQGGTPAAGAIVYLRLGHDSGETSTLLSALTDATGTFLLQSNFARTAGSSGWFDVEGPGGDALHVEVATGDTGLRQWDRDDAAVTGTLLDLGPLGP